MGESGPDLTKHSQRNPNLRDNPRPLESLHFHHLILWLLACVGVILPRTDLTASCILLCQSWILAPRPKVCPSTFGSTMVVKVSVTRILMNPETLGPGKKKDETAHDLSARQLEGQRTSLELKGLNRARWRGLSQMAWQNGLPLGLVESHSSLKSGRSQGSPCNARVLGVKGGPINVPFSANCLWDLSRTQPYHLSPKMVGVLLDSL